MFRHSKPVPTGSSVWWMNFWKIMCLVHEDFNHKSADLTTVFHTDSLSPSLKHTSAVQPWRSQNDPLYYRNKKRHKTYPAHTNASSICRFDMYSCRIWSVATRGAVAGISINRFLLRSVLGENNEESVWRLKLSSRNSKLITWQVQQWNVSNNDGVISPGVKILISAHSSFAFRKWWGGGGRKEEVMNNNAVVFSDPDSLTVW